ncbi:MAG: hypothetical protein DRP14_04835, partial [Candidatus Aenigmatarchaeota archaeon]
VMIEIKPCFLFAFKYLREKNVSKDILLRCLVPARHRPALRDSGEAGRSVVRCFLKLTIDK